MADFIQHHGHNRYTIIDSRQCLNKTGEVIKAALIELTATQYSAAEILLGIEMVQAPSTGACHS